MALSGLESEMLDALMTSHERHALPVGFLDQQPEITSRSRQQLADWMIEISEAFRCDKDCFVTATNYLDRYLTRHAVPLSQLQLVGASALLIASKNIGMSAIHIESLCKCMDNAFTPAQIKAEEMQILNALGWYLEVNKPHDYLELFLKVLEAKVDEFLAEGGLGAVPFKAVRRHAEVFVDMCYTESQFVPYGPAVVAASCLYCAVVQLVEIDCVALIEHLLNNLESILRQYQLQEQLQHCVRSMRELLLMYDMGPNVAVEAAEAAQPEPVQQGSSHSPNCIRDVEAFIAHENALAEQVQHPSPPALKPPTHKQSATSSAVGHRAKRARYA